MDGACDLGFQISDFKMSRGLEELGAGFVATPRVAPGCRPRRMIGVWGDSALLYGAESGTDARLFGSRGNSPPGRPRAAVNAGSNVPPSDRRETPFLADCSLATQFQEFNLRLITNLNRSLTEICET
jgi:hypothetical protein